MVSFFQIRVECKKIDHESWGLPAVVFWGATIVPKNNLMSFQFHQCQYVYILSRWGRGRRMMGNLWWNDTGCIYIYIFICSHHIVVLRQLWFTMIDPSKLKLLLIFCLVFREVHFWGRSSETSKNHLGILAVPHLCHCLQWWYFWHFWHFAATLDSQFESAFNLDSFRAFGVGSIHFSNSQPRISHVLTLSLAHCYLSLRQLVQNPRPCET